MWVIYGWQGRCVRVYVLACCCCMLAPARYVVNAGHAGTTGTGSPLLLYSSLILHAYVLGY